MCVKILVVPRLVVQKKNSNCGKVACALGYVPLTRIGSALDSLCACAAAIVVISQVHIKRCTGAKTAWATEEKTMQKDPVKLYRDRI